MSYSISADSPELLKKKWEAVYFDRGWPSNATEFIFKGEDGSGIVHTIQI